MTIQRNDWSLQRKGIIDQERHKDRVKEAIRKNLGSIVSNEAIILSDGKRTVKVPIKALDEYKFRFNSSKGKTRGPGRRQDSRWRRNRSRRSTRIRLLVRVQDQPDRKQALITTRQK